MSTFVEKLLGAEQGCAAKVTPDYIVVNDGVSHTAVDMATSVADPSRVLVVFDHDVPTGSPEGAMIFGKINRFAKQYGTKFIQAKGVGYQYMLNEIVKPGQIIVGGGSHGAIFGADGVLGINISATELARVLESGLYNTIVPETVVIGIAGSLSKGVSIMDAAMMFLDRNKNIAGKAIEFTGGDLSAHQKAVLCSMACNTGAYTASFTEAKNVAMTLDLSEAIPMITLPCESRDAQDKAKIRALSTLVGTEVHAGQIGGYTGGTIDDLRLAASLIEGKKLALGFRLCVAPATSTDYIKAMDEGVLERLIDYGAQISAAGDHSVMSNGAGVIGSGEKLVTTGLYTFAGCMGVTDSEVYTVSVESVIAASYQKHI